MNIIDLSHPISPGMPVYPGTEPPEIRIRCLIDEVGFLEKKIAFSSHTGTHVDAPAHIVKNSKTLDQLQIDHFYGEAFTLNCTDIKNQIIEIKDLEPYHDNIMRARFLLIHTGWSQYWGSEKYFSNYPVFSLEAAEWLSGFRLKGIGFDTISADKENSKDLPVHKTLLGNNIIIIENLTDLEQIPHSQFTFSAFP